MEVAEEFLPDNHFRYGFEFETNDQRIYPYHKHMIKNIDVLKEKLKKFIDDILTFFSEEPDAIKKEEKNNNDSIIIIESLQSEEKCQESIEKYEELIEKYKEQLDYLRKLTDPAIFTKDLETLKTLETKLETVSDEEEEKN